MKEKILEAGNFLKNNGFALSKQFEDSISNLENPHYRIAVVGKFSVGKSTLINRVFLKDEILLKEGVGLACTAVTAEVTYGEKKQLAISKWKKQKKIVSMEIDGKTESTEAEVTVGEEPPVIIDDPTPADIARYTTATCQEERTRLAAETAAIKLFWPNQHLRQYTICDTPGVDDPNQELLNYTTYRVIPTVDLVILVVACQNLDQIDTDLLRSRVFDEGISRVMVLVSYRPDSGRDSETRSEIKADIKAKLASIGRDNLPIELYCFDQSIDGDIFTISDDIELAILMYLGNNVQTARIDKATAVARKDLQVALIKVATELTLAGKNDSERQQFFRDIGDKEKELNVRYDNVINNIGDELTTLRRRLVPELDIKINTIMENFAQSFDQCPDLSTVQARLIKADRFLRSDVEKVMFDFQQNITDQIKIIAERHEQKLGEIRSVWNNVLDVNLHIEGGIFEKVPPFLVTIGDLLLSIYIGPLGTIGDIILRLVAEKVPLLRKITPSAIVLNLTINAVKSSLRKESEGIVQTVSERFEETFEMVRVKLSQEIESSFIAETAAVKTAAEKAPVSPRDTAALQRLTSVKAELEKMLTSL